MKTQILHTSLFASLSLLMACSVGGQSNNPDAGVYDDYYSETPDADGGAQGSQGEPEIAKTSTTTATSSASAAKIAKALAAKKPKVAGKKKKKKKKKRNKKKGKKFKVGFDGAVPSAASKGSLVEVFGTSLDQEGLMVAIGGKPQEIVEATEDRVVIRVVGGSKGKLQLGKTPAKGKTFKPVAESSEPFVVIGGALGKRSTVEQGLVGSVYAIDEGTTALPDGLEADPIATVAVDNIDISSDMFKAKLGGRAEWFMVHFKGSLNITEGGEYTFCLNADDGAALYLDGNNILNNDGAHEAANEVCESFAVDPGEFELDLVKYQGAKGPMTLQLTWQLDGGEKQAVPASALFPPETVADYAFGAKVDEE